MSDNNTDRDEQQGEELLPQTTYKNKRTASDDERFRLNAELNTYLFNNCDHEHDGYPNHLACRPCVLDCLAFIASRASVAAVEGDAKAPTTPSDAAIRAAEEISDALLSGAITENQIGAIAEIFTRNLAGIASPEIPETSDASWRLWFDRMGDKATAEVVNATANLVTNERLIALAEAGILPGDEK